MTKLIDMTGCEVHGIKVIARAGHRAGKPSWECICACGTKFIAAGSALRAGRAKACGECSRESARQSNIKHSDTGSKEFTTYSAMKARCYDQKNKQYARYGGRGITVCERWLDSYMNFLSDMGRKPTPKHSLERMDTNGIYEPSNCVWATLEQQANNRSNNTRIEINGRTQNLTQWAKETGLNRTVILRRMKRGLSGEALIEPAQRPVITANGITDTIAGWSIRTGIKASTISARIRAYGWSEEKAVSFGAK